MFKIKKQNILASCLFLWCILIFVFFIIIANEISYLNFISDFVFASDISTAIFFGVYIGGGSVIGLISNFKYDNESPLIQFQTMFFVGLFFSIIILLSPFF